MKFAEYVVWILLCRPNLEKKLLQFQRYRIFPRGYFLARPVLPEWNAEYRHGLSVQEFKENAVRTGLHVNTRKPS